MARVIELHLPSLTVTTLQEIGSTTVTTSLDRQLDK